MDDTQAEQTAQRIVETVARIQRERAERCEARLAEPGRYNPTSPKAAIIAGIGTSADFYGMVSRRWGNQLMEEIQAQDPIALAPRLEKAFHICRYTMVAATVARILAVLAGLWLVVSANASWWGVVLMAVSMGSVVVGSIGADRWLEAQQKT